MREPSHVDFAISAVSCTPTSKTCDPGLYPSPDQGEECRLEREKNQQVSSEYLEKFLLKQNYRGEVAFWSKTTIKPVISRIRYFDTALLNTDTIMVKVN